MASLLAMGALLALVGSAAAGPYEDGVKAFERGDHARAVKLWRPLAGKGHAQAQLALGVYYGMNEGKRPDYKEAAAWLAKSARQNNALAQHLLGMLYEKGDGVPKDAGKAADWFRKAADQGLAEAQTRLGNLYVSGLGVKADPKAAANWFRLAAEQGDAIGQYNLGLLHYDGRGVAQSDVMAYFLFDLSSRQGIEVGGSNRDHLARRMSAGDVSLAGNLARNWQVGAPLPDIEMLAALAASLPEANPGNEPAKLPCEAADDLRNTYTPVQLYLSINDCVAAKRYREASYLFAMAGVYGRYDQLRVKDRSAHQAVALLKTAVTPHFTDEFRAFLGSYLEGARLAELCAAMRKVGRPDYFPGYMINHGLGAIQASLEGKPGDADASPLLETVDPDPLWAEALDSYLHCPG